MNRDKFFAAMRPAFGGKLDQDQVNGIAALINTGEGLPVHHMANILANVRRETGGGMAPIKETVMPWHKNKRPSDKAVIGRLDRAYAAGKLPWVKTPYWRSGWFGRGQIQITHKANYDRFGIGKDAALDFEVSADIAVRGMRDGMFTGRKLGDYNFPSSLDNQPETNPRRIVNGNDGSDKEVAGFHRQFVKALADADWGAPVVVPAAPTPFEPAEAPQGLWARFLQLIFGKGN